MGQDSLIDQQIEDAIERIDDVLARNLQLVWIVIFMSIVIFVIGATLLSIGFYSKDWRVLMPSAIITGLLYWPINKIITIRKENIQLAVVPALIRTLPPQEAAQEIVKLIDKIKP